jgi:hypothetical protein
MPSLSVAFGAILSCCPVHNGDEGMPLLVHVNRSLGLHLVSWAPTQLFLVMSLQVFGRIRRGGGGVGLFSGCCLRRIIGFGVLAPIYVLNREPTEIVIHPSDES